MLSQRLATRRTWRSTTHMRGRPEQVLDALTDPAACARWSGVAFTVWGLHGPRLITGSQARVTGEIVGRRVDFDLRVLEAGPRRLRLRAAGPVELAATYRLAPTGDGCQVDAAVTVGRAAVSHGAVIALGAQMMLSMGALEHALARLTDEVETGPRAVALERPRSAA